MSSKVHEVWNLPCIEKVTSPSLKLPAVTEFFFLVISAVSSTLKLIAIS